MNQIVSEDSLRRALLRIAETEEGVTWLQTHLYKCYQPLLDVPWILDGQHFAESLKAMETEILRNSLSVRIA